MSEQQPPGNALMRVARGYPNLPLVREALRVLVPAIKRGALPPPSGRPWEAWKLYRPDNAVIEAQHLATRIMAVFGIESTRVLVVFDDKLEAAGRIELHDGREFFVEVRGELRNHPRKIAATLGHEVAHIFLRRHQLERVDVLENEILTDTTAALYGFGALMADAYEVNETRWTDDHGKTWLRRTESGMGYLTPDELGYVLTRGGFADVDAYLRSAHSRQALRAGRAHARRELRSPPLRSAPLWARALYLLHGLWATLVHYRAGSGAAPTTLREDQRYALDRERVSFRCVQCTQALRVPRGKQLQARCPACEHRMDCTT